MKSKVRRAKKVPHLRHYAREDQFSMTIRIYDSKTGDKQPFEPLEKGHVRIYVCGITAYDYCHIGHARSALVFDMIVRYFRFCGYKVTYVRNFTDIDDKIINRAAEKNVSCDELAETFINKFHEDMQQLGIDPPSHEPKATEHVQEIIEMVEELVRKGHAYQVDNDVYYRVQSFGTYGALSGRNLEDMQAGARITVNENKENPMDFALWKGSKPGEPTWESPWGPGRPGWHIECSAMSRKFLGDTFDIHGGGKDLLFPHHENEVAQSEAVSGKPFARFWVHNGFVTISDEKMSKSLGNFLTIREVLEKYSPETLRLFAFSSHYRTPLDYSDAAIQEAAAGLDRLYNCLAEIGQLPAEGIETPAKTSKKDAQKINTIGKRFCDAMDNDFNTAQALGILFDAAKTMNRIRQALSGKPAEADLKILREGAAALRSHADIMGLLREDPIDYVNSRKQATLAALGMDEKALFKRIDERNAARAAKDWAMADAIRDELLEKGIEIKDSAEGTTWSVRS